MAVAVAGVALAGCSTDSSSSAAVNSPAASSSATGCDVAVTDAWIKSTDGNMTGVFGQITNKSDQNLVITGASTALSGQTELHETTNGTMKQVAEFDIPAQGTFVLAPGGNHIMLMNLTNPVVAGEDVAITLTCQGGGTTSFTATAKPFSGANESYAPSSDMHSGGM